MNKEKICKALSLFRFFFTIGWFTFGGGWSIVAQMEKEFVEKRKDITSEELLDIVSVGRSLPGIMISNIAYLYGYSQAGILGGVLSLIGMVLPPVTILYFVTLAYSAFRDNIYIAKMLVGVRAAVVPIIMLAALKLRKAALGTKLSYIIFAVAFLLSALLDVNCVIIIFFGIICGFLFTGKEPKEAD